MKIAVFWKSPWLPTSLLALLAGGTAATDNFLTGYGEADVCALENEKLVQFSPETGALYIYKKGELDAWIADYEYVSLPVSSRSPKIAVDGDTVVIAECGGRGMACILEKAEGLWTSKPTIVAPTNKEDPAEVLSSVSVSEGVIVFGSDGVSNVFIFSKDEEGHWTQIQTIEKAPSAPPGLGKAVRVLGDYMVVSAVGDKRGTGDLTGNVYVYVKDPVSGDWNMPNGFPNSGLPKGAPIKNYGFGWDLDLTSTKIVIGAPGETSSQNGYVAVYDRNTYNEIGIITGSTDTFGSLVAADDERILVSSPDTSTFDVSVYSSEDLSKEPNNIVYNANPTSVAVSNGQACVGISEEGAYVDSLVYRPPDQEIDPPANSNGRFGDECAIDAQAQTMVILAPYEKEVYIYSKSATGKWDFETSVEDVGIAYAPAAAVEGNTIVYGACNGKGYNFCILERKDNGEWPSTPLIFQPLKDEVGITEGRVSAISISEGTIAIGVNQKNHRTFIFTKDTGAWTQVQELAPPDPVKGGAFGQSVQLLGDKMVIGAPAKAVGEIILAGEAYVYGKVNGQWVPEGVLQSETSVLKGRFGWEVAITSSKILVGASSFLTDQPGFVHVFNKTTLDPLATITDGASTIEDRFGWRVAGNEERIFITTEDDKKNGFGGHKLYIYSDDFTREVGTPISFPKWAFSLSMGGGELCIGLISGGKGGRVLVYNFN